jgi:DNA-binding protein
MAENVTNSVVGLKQQLKQATMAAQELGAALAQMNEEGSTATADQIVATEKEMSKAVDTAAKLKDQMADTNEQIKVLSAGSPFEQMSNGLGDVGSKLMSLDFAGAKESAGRLAAIGKSISFKTATKSLKDLGSTFMSLGKALLSNPLFLIPGAIALLVYGIIKLMDKIGLLKVITKAIGEVFDWLMIPINAIIQGLKDLTDWFGWTSNAATDAAVKEAAAAEKVAAAYESKSADVVRGLDTEIKIAELSGESTRKSEYKKAFWIQYTAKVRAKADADAYIAAVKLGELDEKELEDLKKKAIASNQVYKQAGDNIKIMNAGFRKEDKDANKIAADDKLNFEDDANKKAADAQTKANEDAKARRASQLDATKYLEDLILENMEEGIEKELAINDKKFERLIASNASNMLITQQQRDAIDIQLKDQAFQNEKDILQKQTDETNEIIRVANENKANKKIEDAAKELETLNNLNALKNETYLTASEQEILALQTTYNEKLLLAGNDAALRLALEKQFETDKAAIKAAEREKDRQEDIKAVQAGLDVAKQGMNAIQGLSDAIFAHKNKNLQKGSAAELANAKKQFKINKAMQLGGAVIDGAKAVMSSLASSPVAIGPIPNPAGIASLAFVGISAAASIAKIAAAKFEGGGSAPSGTTAPSINSSVALTPSVNLFGQPNQGNNATGQQSAEGGSNAITVTAVVSETEITSTQQNVANMQKNSSL